MPDNHGRMSPALVEAFAGFAAGNISTLAVHPLDVIKTRLQVHRSTSSAPISSLSVLRSLTSNASPIQSLYRGLTPNLIGNSFSWGIFFYFKSRIEDSIGELRNRPINDSHSFIRGQYKLGWSDHFVASGSSGLLIAVGTAPIWVLKTRIVTTDKGSDGAYTSMWQGAKDIWKTEGLRGFYRGLGASCLGVSHGAVQFAVYDSMKSFWAGYLERTPRTIASGGKDRDGEQKLSNTATTICSLSSKVIAGVTTYPYQPIRSRMQTKNAEERFGKGFTGVAKRIFREEGIRGFYRGVGTSVIRVLPATWVTFLVYENVKYYLPFWAGDE
ncbi:mitochondrial carrier protein-like protein [Coleophoma cylindrospora]|uniref:Mitochondrial carrier protein-like protein n=1 Tax=Coleophoma cylindrospora TaxID=1849047 RepID=A0A3D8SSP0_9HELO|nr:mitochondrial carrier protein-like protein [Coleophoma cylindrospora]